MNYFESIENKYSQIRGLPSRLSPIEWQLIDDWQKQNIPLRIVLRAMGDVQEKFKALNRKDKINSLKYFSQEVNKQFSEWQTSQIGKHTENETVFTEKKDMGNLSFAQVTDGVEETVSIIGTIVSKIPTQNNYPEPLKSAAAKARGELLHLADETKKKRLSMDDVETRLKELKKEFEISLILTFSDRERTEMIETVKREYTNPALTDEMRQKVLVRKLYHRFDLPEITLFEI